MNELDCIKLIKPFKDLKVGTRGCIVLKYTENDFEVEFFDSAIIHLPRLLQYYYLQITVKA